MVTVGVDFAYNETIRDVLRAIRAHEGKIVDFDPDGPAGGNPMRDAALRFLKGRYREDGDEFNLSRIR